MKDQWSVRVARALGGGVQNSDVCLWCPQGFVSSRVNPNQTQDHIKKSSQKEDFKSS